ncbi:hypothetical protein FO519_003052 [Halicephalobus sp. NKZ332]|nr:hypothetical protein FO519_003052 [Halicephalobus sp. NKZ332]
MTNTGLSVVGYYWVILSFISSICVLVGFYMPYWISGYLDLNGKKEEVYFGSFRRCNYPTYDIETKQFRIENLCGRYATFSDIPSVYWQISTVSVALGGILALILTFILIPACCLKNIISKNTAIMVGLLQVVAAVLVAIGCVLYPLGWDNQEVLDACGSMSGRYILGECQIGWAYILMLAGSGLLITCGALSICGGRDPDPPLQYSTYRNRCQPEGSGQAPSRYSFDAETLIDHNLRRHSAAASGRRLSNQRNLRPLNPTHLPVCDF